MIEGIEYMFTTSRFSDLYGYVRQKRRDFGLEVDTDESFEEAKAIITRFRKYVSTAGNSVKLNCNDLDDVKALILERIETADDVPTSRNEMVFIDMRDEWLTGIYNVLNEMTKEDDDA